MPASRIVSYRVDENTVAQFEIEPPEGFKPAAGVGQIIADVQGAIGPAVDAARVVLDRVRPLGADSVEVRFGVKVSGSADWLVAKVAAEGTFEITLVWRPTG
jgi:Trypsin-co-occurring domain 1